MKNQSPNPLILNSNQAIFPRVDFKPRQTPDPADWPRDFPWVVPLSLAGGPVYTPSVVSHSFNTMIG